MDRESKKESSVIFEKNLSDIINIPGVDLIYFLDSDYKISKSYKKNNVDFHLDEVKNVIKIESGSKLSKDEPSGFHTMSFLSENGLIIISKLCTQDKQYLIAIAGEREPVDLIKLLKCCKEMKTSI